MKLYIPEIGDKLLLKKPWTFPLFPEKRNQSVADYFHGKHFKSRSRDYKVPLWVPEDKVSYQRPQYDVEKKNRWEAENPYPKVEMPFLSLFGSSDNRKRREKWQERQANSDWYKEFSQKMEEWVDQINEHGTPSLLTTFPPGTILTVDRIYIRKGASEYSSLSFFVTLPKRFKPHKGKMRMFARLSHCNQIEFSNFKST
jgi:hypothetical protein